MGTMDWKQDARKRGMLIGPEQRGTIEIEAAPSRVWDVISAPGNLRHCHPFCALNTIERWPGIGSRDWITYYSGIRYQRDVVDWIEGIGYDLEVGSPTKKTCRVLWRIREPEPQVSVFSIAVFSFLDPDWTPAGTQHYLDRFFGKTFDHYLDCVVRGVNHHVVTGEDVSEDQFGANPVFSARRSGG